MRCITKLFALGVVISAERVEVTEAGLIASHLSAEREQRIAATSNSGKPSVTFPEDVKG